MTADRILEIGILHTLRAAAVMAMVTFALCVAGE
jgi:hypothetical protein